MKSNKIFLSISAMFVAAIVMVAIVSCKKEDNAALSGQKQTKEAFNVPQVEDMMAYLKDFKQKMLSASKDEDEALSLEEAAWHLSSVANYDFGQINVEFDNVRFDTLFAHVDVTNGSVLLSDLGVAYENIRNDIETHFQKVNLNEKHIRFVDASIDEDGYTCIPIVISYKTASKGWGEHHWYYPNLNEHFTYADSICDVYFSEDSVYVWNGLGLSELVRLLNLTEHHDIIGDNQSSNIYVKTREHTFGYLSNIDPYGSPSNYYSRLFGALGNPYYVIPKTNMCYYLDSYLGLGYQYLIDNPIAQYADECPAIWSITTANQVFPPDHSATYYHVLNVTYCYSCSNGSGYNE